MSSHWYDAKGNLVAPGTGWPSVSTVLDIRDKPSLNEFKLRVGVEEAYRRQKESSARGNRIHKVITDWIEGWPIESDSETDLTLEAFESWREKYQPEIIGCEVFLQSKKYKYRGRCDLICRIDGELYIVDYKSGAAYWWQGYQLRGYEQAYFEMKKEHAKMATLQLPCSDIKRLYRFKMHDAPLEAFLAHKVIFDDIQKHEKPYSRAVNIKGGILIAS